MTAEIIHGDCLEVLRGMADASVDAVVTDPPFGVRDEAWDSMTPREFARFSMSWIAEARRIAPELVVFCTADSAIRDICGMLYENVRQIIWNKPMGSQYAGASDARMWFAHEVILHCHDRPSGKAAAAGRSIRVARERAGLSRGTVDIAVRGKRTGLCYRWEEGACLPTREQVETLRRVVDLPADFDTLLSAEYSERDDTLSLHRATHTDVLTHRTVTRGVHPCEKPVPLLVDLLQTVGAEYRTVVDPFLGSGSTGEACALLGRGFLGVDEDAAYVEIARQRIADAQAQMSLGVA